MTNQARGRPGPVPISPREHIDVVNQAVPDPADREEISWNTGDALFKLNLDA